MTNPTSPSDQSGLKSQMRESFLARSLVGLMLIAVATSSLVLGVIAVVAISKDDSSSSASSEASATIVQVRLTEFAVVMSPDTIPPGDVTFQVFNAGAVEHNFAIPSVNKQTAMLKPGEAEEFVVSGLQAGSLPVICQVVGHEAAGMKATLNVVKGASSAAMDHSAMGTPMTWQEMDKMM